MGYVRYTQEELTNARDTDMIYFLERQNGFHFKSEGGSYRCEEHNSLVVSRDRKRWYWNSHNIGGNNALDWLQSIEKLDFQTACSVLISKSSYDKMNFKNSSETISQERKPFELPKAFQGAYKQVYAYLAYTRNINHEVIKYCFDNKMIYQDTKNNAVFVGYNEDGVAAFAEKKGTLSNVQYRGNISGSDKKYSFHIDSKDKKNDRVFVFEAPIDLLAHCSINNIKAKVIGKNPNWENAFLNHNRLSLSGTTMVALDAYLTSHPEIRNITVCTDNDEAGKKCADSISAKYLELGYSVTYASVKKGKDYAEYLDLIKHGAKKTPKLCSTQYSCKI